MVKSFVPSMSRTCKGLSFSPKQHVGGHWVMLAAQSTGDDERVLTNEECDVLNLPYGTTLVGEMSDRLS
jgi:hypothetical protein